MPELIAKSALDGQPPVTLAGVTLTELSPGPITSIAIFPGAGRATLRALKPMGLGFPEPNQWLGAGDARIVWTGRDQAFLIGTEPPSGLEGSAALTDQAGGWSVVSLRGPMAVDVLMRLVPLDLRVAAFPVGRAARAPLNHINAVLLRVGEYAFEIMVFRSMARTAWHEIVAAMQALEARAALKP
ncbi:MAG: sarcosine oxidase subunit gamma [Tabrizicola sp.]|nr:sarcosine oxidase subunit gamma [Tabrizicola sp.]